MVQGTTKGLQSKARNNTRHSHKTAANTKKGRRVVAPKKATAIKQTSMHKVGPCSGYCTIALIPNSQFLFASVPILIPIPILVPFPLLSSLSFFLSHNRQLN